MSCLLLRKPLVVFPPPPVEFPQTLTIGITELSMLHGRRLQACRCPIALEVQKQFPLANVTVGLQDVTIVYFGSGKCASYKLDEAGQRWRERFDNGLPVELETFTATWQEIM